MPIQLFSISAVIIFCGEKPSLTRLSKFLAWVFNACSVLRRCVRMRSQALMSFSHKPYSLSSLIKDSLRFLLVVGWLVAFWGVCSSACSSLCSSALRRLMLKTLVSTSFATVPLLVALNVAKPVFSSLFFVLLYVPSLVAPIRCQSPINASPVFRHARIAIQVSMMNAWWSVWRRFRSCGLRLSFTNPEFFDDIQRPVTLYGHCNAPVYYV